MSSSGGNDLWDRIFGHKSPGHGLVQGQSDHSQSTPESEDNRKRIVAKRSSGGHGLVQSHHDSQSSSGSTVVQTETEGKSKISSGARLIPNFYDFPDENRQKRLDYGRALVQSNPNKDDPGQWTVEEKIKVYIAIMARPRLDPMLTDPLRIVMKGYQKHCGEVAGFSEKIFDMIIGIKAVVQMAQCQLDRLFQPSTKTCDIPEICTNVLSIMSTQATPKLMEIAALIPKRSLDLSTNTPVVQYCVKFHEMMEDEIQALVVATSIAYLLKEQTFPTMEIVASLLGLNMVLSPRRVQLPGRYDRERNDRGTGRYHDREPQKMITYRPMVSLDALGADITDIQPESHSEKVEPKHLQEEETYKILDFCLEDYLFGMLNMAFKLAQLLKFYANHDKYDLLSFIDEFLTTFQASMMTLSYPNTNLRRVYDVLKYRVRECNQIIAELEARGLYTRPTGDGEDTAQVEVLQDI